MKTLTENIELILREEKRSYIATDSRSSGILGSFNIGRGDGWIIQGQDRILIQDPPNSKILQSSRADLLLKLYSSLASAQKIEFQNILLSHLEHSTEFVMVAYLPFFVLFRIGIIVDAIEIIKKEMAIQDNLGYGNSLDLFEKILKYEWNSFTEDQLDKTKTIFSGTDQTSILDRINSIEIKLLEHQLSEINQEINEDKETLVKEFNRFGFPVDLGVTLNKIDQKLITASDDFDFKGCMDLIRSFTERFYASVSSSLKEDTKINGIDSEEVAKFFRAQSLISEDQGKILVSLRHFLSNWGSHRLKSKPEDARLSRNMAIEFCLYIMRRLQEVKNRVE